MAPKKKPNSQVQEKPKLTPDTAGQKFKAEGKSFASFAITFFWDTARVTWVILSVYFVSWLLHLGRYVGVSGDRLESFEQLQYWIDYATLAMLGLMSLTALVKEMRSEGKH